MSENQKPGDTGQPSEDVISDYYDGVKQLEMEGYETGIKKARNALFITAALIVIGEVIAVARLGVGFPPIAILIIAIEAGLFIGLALWTKSKPYTAIIIGLILFILFWVLQVVLNGGAGIYSGIIVKVIIIVVLVGALKPAKAWEDLKKNS